MPVVKIAPKVMIRMRKVYKRPGGKDSIFILCGRLYPFEITEAHKINLGIGGCRFDPRVNEDHHIAQIVSLTKAGKRVIGYGWARASLSSGNHRIKHFLLYSRALYHNAHLNPVGNVMALLAIQKYFTSDGRQVEIIDAGTVHPRRKPRKLNIDGVHMYFALMTITRYRPEVAK